MKIKRWLRRLWCRITGGHQFADSNLRTVPVPEYGVTCFCNKCLKCGEWKAYAVEDKALYYDGFPLYEQFGSVNDG